VAMMVSGEGEIFMMDDILQTLIWEDAPRCGPFQIDSSPFTVHFHD